MSKRTSMLGSAVRDIIAPVLRRCPPDCGIVSITSVQVSSDFSYATAYITALQHPEKALEFLIAELPDLQRSLSALHRRRIPRVRFRLDTDSAESDRIDALLDRASKQLPQDSSTTTQEGRD